VRESESVAAPRLKTNTSAGSALEKARARFRSHSSPVAHGGAVRARARGVTASGGGGVRTGVVGGEEGAVAEEDVDGGRGGEEALHLVLAERRDRDRHLLHRPLDARPHLFEQPELLLAAPPAVHPARARVRLVARELLRLRDLERDPPDLDAQRHRLERLEVGTHRHRVDVPLGDHEGAARHVLAQPGGVDLEVAQNELAARP